MNQERGPASRPPITLAALERAARRRWWFGVVLVVGAVAMSLGFVSRSSQYESSATLRLRTPGSLSDFVRTDSLDYLDRLANTYGRLATSAAARDEVAVRVGLPMRPAVSVRFRPNNELFEIAAASSSPTKAAAIANAAAQVLLDTIARQDETTLARANPRFEKTAGELRAAIAETQRQIEALESDGASTSRLAELNIELRGLTDAALRNESAYAEWRAQLLDRTNLLSVVDPARPSPSPQGVPVEVAVVLAVLGALAVFASVVLVGERLRTTVDTDREAADAAGAPSAGLVSRTALSGDTREEEAELRHLRASVMGIIGQRTRGALVIADAAQLDASHELGLGLAAAIAEVSQSVAVVQLVSDSQVAPIVAAGMPPRLDEVLEGRSPLGEALVPGGRPGVLWLAGTGLQPIAPSLFGKLLTDLLGMVDLVVVIGPPVRSSADTLAVAGEVGDVVLVASLGSTRADDLRAAAHELSAVGATVRATVSVAPATRRRVVASS